MFGLFERKSSKCENCGKWSFDEEKQYSLEKRINYLCDYIQSSNKIFDEEKKYLLEKLWGK